MAEYDCDGVSTDVSTPAIVHAWVRAERSSVPHTVGTCAMGDTPDLGSVVDTHGMVHGIDGLAVIDASTIPRPPSGFPHIVTIMLAERLSAELASDAP